MLNNFETEIDPNSDKYRICRNCKIEFMANHGNDRYCSEECYSEFHKKESKLLRICATGKINGTAHNLQVIDINLSGLQRNIEQLYIKGASKKGMFVEADELLKAGFDFRAYSRRYLVSEATQGLFAEYGPFIMHWEKESVVFVKLKSI